MTRVPISSLLIVAALVASGCGSPSAPDKGDLSLGRASTIYAATCYDTIKNFGETAIDCGGACMPCGTGKTCTVAADCQSGVCHLSGAQLYCRAPGLDFVKNGDESDVDCGGTWPNSGATLPCANGKICYSSNNCRAGSLCVNFICTGPTCTDGLKNGTETGTDCGGTCPNKCSMGSQCVTGADCQSGICTSGYCAVPAHCSNHTMDGDETGSDCGGSCKQCLAGVACNLGVECQSGICQGNLCQAPSCTDGVKNGTETSPDCGGTCLTKCALGQECILTTDCGGGMTCVNHSCTATVNMCLATASPYAPAVVCPPAGSCTVGVCNPLSAGCSTAPSSACAKDITSFTIPGASSTISGTNISLTMPCGTDVTSLTPTIAITGTSVVPASGVATAFTNSVNYVVSAADNSTKPYFVTVTVAQCSAKDIITFTINGVGGNITNSNNSTITLTLPFGTDVTSLTPIITVSTGATVSLASGVTTGFSSPVNYVVTGADNSTKTYLVTVTVAPADYEWALWAIPADQPVAATAYTNPTNGTVIDVVTGLRWQKYATTTHYTWTDAKSHCGSLSLDGYIHWRLPSLIELESIVRYNASPAIDVTVFPSTEPNFFWSSSPYVQGSVTGYAWTVVFSVGQTGPMDIGTTLPIRCVQ